MATGNAKIISVGQMSRKLSLGNEGWWAAATVADVSYPEDGSQGCYQLEDGSFWFQHRNDCLLAAMEKFPPSGTIVDCGGGNGFVAQAIQKRGWSVVLLEPSLSGVRNARARGIEQIIHGTFQDAGFDPGMLPAVGLFDVIEHVEDDHKLLMDVRSALAEGGRIYLTVPAHTWLWSSDDVHAGHFRRYTAGTLTKALAKAGYHVDYVTHLFTWLPLPIFCLRTLPSLIGLQKSGGGARAQREHQSRFSGLMRKLMSGDLANIRRGGSSRLGSSCLAVAHKAGEAGRVSSR